MTLSDTVGDNRSNAIWRILFLVVNVATAFIPLIAILALGIMGAIGFMIADIFLRLLMNDDASDARGTYAEEFILWPADMLGWMIYGDRPFPWLPNF